MSLYIYIYMYIIYTDYDYSGCTYPYPTSANKVLAGSQGGPMMFARISWGCFFFEGEGMEQPHMSPIINQDSQD